MSKEEEKEQFKRVIKADLNRWFAESDLDVEELTGSAVKAIEEWLDEDIIEFKAE